MSHGSPIPYSLYIYAPNKTLPILFTLFYATSFALHLHQCQQVASFPLPLQH
jgi:hypothetical protein